MTKAPGIHSACLSTDQIDSVLRVARDCLVKLSDYYDVQLLEPEIGFKLKGMRAGVFEVVEGKCRIRFNEAMFVSHFDRNLEQTVPHEIAHYAVYRVFGHRVKPHGEQWRDAMLQLDVEPRVYHDFSLENVSVRRQKRFLYRCGCGLQGISTTRHNRIVSGRARYRCGSCGVFLKVASPGSCE